MFTFLKGAYRDKVIREYRKRLSVLYFSMFLLLCLVLVGSTLPLYVSLRSEREAALAELNSLSKKSVESGQVEVEKEVKDIKDMVDVLKVEANRGPLVGILENLFAAENTDIILSSISLERKKDIWVVSMSGRALTREALVGFSEKLEQIPSFSAVDLPVSSLAKSKDISFSISVQAKL